MLFLLRAYATNETRNLNKNDFGRKAVFSNTIVLLLLYWGVLGIAVNHPVQRNLWRT